MVAAAEKNGHLTVINAKGSSLSQSQGEGVFPLLDANFSEHLNVGDVGIGDGRIFWDGRFESDDFVLFVVVDELCCFWI